MHWKTKIAPAANFLQCGPLFDFMHEDPHCFQMRPAIYSHYIKAANKGQLQVICTVVSAEFLVDEVSPAYVVLCKNLMLLIIVASTSLRLN